MINFSFAIIKDEDGRESSLKRKTQDSLCVIFNFAARGKKLLFPRFAIMAIVMQMWG